jgi:4-hydroxy-4-methyl-2-oxoglutarate aldolase
MRVTILSLAALTVAMMPPRTVPAGDETSELQTGKSFIPTPVYSEEEDLELLSLFEGLRVADATDGMDALGLQDVGLMDPEIRPLWKDAKTFRHRFVGIAITARYVPTNRPAAGRRSIEAFDEWVGQWYTELSPEPFEGLIRSGTALVIDDANRADVGSIGSFNILSWTLRGLVGVVTDATARDTDEIEAQGVPLYFRGPGRGIRPGRNQIESVNRPVVCGGALVIPGDVILADGDGVLVVPRAHAAEVARYARTVIDNDKAGRRDLYKKLGLPSDPSVQ